MKKYVDWWDDHYTIEKNLRKRLPAYDQAFASLIEDLRDRGPVGSSARRGLRRIRRSPQVDSYAGRGHWPKAMSAVLSGGGIREGRSSARRPPTAANRRIARLDPAIGRQPLSRPGYRPQPYGPGQSRPPDAAGRARRPDPRIVLRDDAQELQSLGVRKRYS